MGVEVLGWSHLVCGICILSRNLVKAVRKRQACDRYPRLGTYLHCTYTITFMGEGLGVKGTCGEARQIGNSPSLWRHPYIHIMLNVPCVYQSAECLYIA